MHKFYDRFKKLSEYEHDPEELEAGVEIFDKYGFFSTLHSLADGDITKYELILETEADTVFMTLLYNKDKREYEERLKEIYKAQNELSRHR